MMRISGFCILFLLSACLLNPSHAADEHQKETNNDTPLMLAAYNGDIQKMQQLVNQGAPIDERNQYGLTALFFAAGATRTQPTPKGSTEAVKFLLDHGAAASTGSRINGFSPLMAAANNENAESVALLLDHGAAIDATAHGDTALSMAATRLDYRTVKVLLEHGARVNGSTDEGGTPPLLAAVDASPDVPDALNPLGAMSHLEKLGAGRVVFIVRLLIDRGADLNRADRSGRTALTLSIERQNVLVARALLDAGADPNVIDRPMGNASALMLAIRYRQIDITEMLLKKGANVEARDRFGKSALDYARIYGPRGLVGVLRQAGNGS